MGTSLDELDAKWKAAAELAEADAKQAEAKADATRPPITRFTGPALLANLDEIWRAACEEVETKERA